MTSTPTPNGRPLRQALDPAASSSNGTFTIVKEVLLGQFQNDHRRSESVKIFSELAPSLMNPRILGAAGSRGVQGRPNVLARLPSKLPIAALTRRTTSQSLAIEEAIPRLSSLSLTQAESRPGGAEEEPSLLRGFQATVPSSELAKVRRRKVRGGLGDEDLGGEKIGLKRLGDQARGLLTNGSEREEEGLGVGRKQRRRRKARESSVRRVEGKLHLEDLKQQASEIRIDKENLTVRKSLIHTEIHEIAAKIDALADLRRRLESSLLRLQEEDLELDDELEGVQELMTLPNVISGASGGDGITSAADAIGGKSSRRRKGPAFLPSEHDELPRGVAFMTLAGHSAPITALDFTEPYGMLVTAGQDDVVKVWDLCDGEEVGQLRGHQGHVKAIQVEDTLCLTGGADGNVRLWDLRVVEDYEDKLQKSAAESLRQGTLERIQEQDADTPPGNSPCVRTLEGHSKSVTALYYEDGCLVTGSSDKTIRQWDVTTGQCILTMDILWAISNPPPTYPAPVSPEISQGPFSPPRLRHRSSTSFSSVHYDDLLPSPGAGISGNNLLNAVSGQFAIPTPPFSDGSWEMYQDFVGGVQFWGYALASGSGDGGVRMWDMRTGQAHRTLVGHTAPVTCLQFDETNVVSGSLDKTIRIWDLRMGAVSEVHKYEYPVTAVQFDSRKVVACTGENGIEVYNRTTHAHSRLTTNGHIKPAERMRFIDRYLVSGGKDGSAKVWAM